MGPILAILSYVTKTFSKLISLMQKNTNPNYNADYHSNQAIAENGFNVLNNTALIKTTVEDTHNHVVSLNNISKSDVYDASIDVLITYTGGGIIQNYSVWDILRNKLWPRLPSEGTLATTTTATASCKDALKTTSYTGVEQGSIYDVVCNKLAPRLPSSGKIGIYECRSVVYLASSYNYETVFDYSGAGVLNMIQFSSLLNGQSLRITIDNIVFEGSLNFINYPSYAFPYGTPSGRSFIMQDHPSININFSSGLKVEFLGYGTTIHVMYSAQV